MNLAGHSPLLQCVIYDRKRKEIESKKSPVLQQRDMFLSKAVLPKLTLRHRSKAVRGSCLAADKQKVAFTRPNVSNLLDMNIKGIGI